MRRPPTPSEAPASQRVSLCSVRVDPGADGFVMELADADGDSTRLAFPRWVLHQLLRWLPQVERSLRQQEGEAANASGDARPVTAWSLVPRPAGLTLRLQDDRFIETRLQLDPARARALHQALGQALGQSVGPSAGAPPERRDTGT